MMRLLPLVTLPLLALAAGESDQRCFTNNDWGSIVPGEPQVLIWDSGSFWDVLLNSDVHSQANVAGVIARNISQNSVVWIPPKDIAQDPNQVFAVQLWDLAKGTGCVSPAFRFANVEDDDNNAQGTASLPSGPLITTAISLINYGSITATATVATFQNDKAATEHSVTGTITGTDTAVASTTESSTADQDGSSSGPNVLAIAIGTAFGVLVIILIVLSVLLWRARRKRARQRANSNTDTKLIASADHSREQSVIELDARQVAAAEMTGTSSRLEMAAESRPQELPSQDVAPVELPADEVMPPKYPGDWNMSVSSLGGSTMSSFDKGAVVVSPATEPKSYS